MQLPAEYLLNSAHILEVAYIHIYSFCWKKNGIYKQPQAVYIPWHEEQFAHSKFQILSKTSGALQQQVSSWHSPKIPCMGICHQGQAASSVFVSSHNRRVDCTLMQRTQKQHLHLFHNIQSIIFIQSATTKNPIENLVAYFIKSSIVLTTASCQTECHKHASMLYKMLHYKTTFCLQTSSIL